MELYQRLAKSGSEKLYVRFMNLSHFHAGWIGTKGPILAIGLSIPGYPVIVVLCRSLCGNMRIRDDRCVSAVDESRCVGGIFADSGILLHYHRLS